MAHGLQTVVGMRTIAMVLGMAAMLTGCVTDADTVGDEPSGAVGGKGDGASAGLARTYALELRSSMRLEDDREPDPADRFSQFDLRARALVTTTQTGTAVELSVKLCDVALPMVQGYQPTLDPALIAGLPAVVLAGELTDGRLTTAPAAIVLGAALADPVMDMLPRTSADARVRDQDRDGKPGVSIKVGSLGKIHAAMRVLLALDAPVTTAASISGDAELRLDQAILGDDIFFYDAAGAAAESEGHVTVVSATNAFRMKSNVGTCAQVIAALP